MHEGVVGFYVDLFQPYVQALEQFALAMDKMFGIPWPLVIAALYVPFLLGLNLLVWWMRGTVWPLACDYPTAKRGACKNRALGEWHRCHVHSARRLRWTDRHLIQPELRRWETFSRGRVVERADAYGRGVVLMKTERLSALYHRGFARPPRNAFRLMPGVVRDHAQRIWSIVRELRELGLRALLLSRPQRTSLGVSPLLEHTIRATRLTSALVVAALVVVGISIVAHSTVKAALEYGDEFVFIGAMATGRSGIGHPGPRWLQRAGRDFVAWSLPWIVVVLYSAVLIVTMSDQFALLKSSAAVLFAFAVAASFLLNPGRRRRRA
jgi:hypothetical protein